MKFLIIRTDRIGDVILSLPVAQTIKEHVPDAEIHMMIREPIAELISEQPFIDQIITYNNQGMRKVARSLRNERFDIAILLHPTFPLSLELFLARIPQRIGTGFRWYSFLLNRRIYEHRHTSERHEIMYNLGLLKPLGIELSRKEPYLAISEPQKQHAAFMLKTRGIDPENFVLIHPGSGGSTLAWPEQSYATLVSLLANRTDYALVLSGSIDEQEVTERIHRKVRERLVNMTGETTLKELAGIISLARLFIGNSTGPMHIASATKTPTVAFFPPSRANRKIRWAPLSPSLVFEPPVPYCHRCIRERCEHYNCMTLIDPEEVIEKVQEWLKDEITK
jgi:heptosyltransferase-2